MNHFFRSSITLISGAALARAFGLAAIPVLSRLYTPTEFGAFALYSATVLVLAPLATLRYHVAIPLPRSENSAAALLIVCMVLMLLFAIFLSGMLVVADNIILATFSLTPLAPFVFLIPLGVIAASLFETMTMCATRQHAFKTIAWAQVFQSFVGEGLKVGFAFAKMGPAGLMVGHLSGHSFGAGVYSFKSASWIRNALRGVSMRKIKEVVVRYRGFPILRAPSHVLLAIAAQSPLFLTAAYFGTSVAGQMGIAMLAFMAPFSLIGQAAGRAYFAEISKVGAHRPDLIQIKLKVVTRILAALSVPIAITLFFFAEPVAAILLGEEWAQAGRFVSALSLALVPQFISATVICTLDVLESHALVISIHASRLLAVVAAFAISVKFDASPEVTIQALSTVLALHYIGQHFLIANSLKKARKAQPPCETY